MASWDDDDEADLDERELPDEMDQDDSDSEDEANCPECGAAIYPDVAMCPRCGYLIPADHATGHVGSRKPLWILLGVAACLLVVILLWIR